MNTINCFTGEKNSNKKGGNLDTNEE